MNVTVVHDYLTQRGGAERVVLEMAKAFPDCTIVTSIYEPDTTFPEYRDLNVVSLGLERVKLFAKDPRFALPILGRAFRSANVAADVVVCSSSGFAHQVGTTAPKIVYCNNPPRWLYQWEDYAQGLPAPARLAMRGLRGRLVRRDKEAASECASYIANSRNVAGRVRAAYGREPSVIHPARGLEPDGPEEAVPGLSPGFFLTVGRARGYKRTDLLLEAFSGMPELTLVTVGSTPEPRTPSNIRQLVGMSDAQMRWLYASAAGLLACSQEDFGLTPVEAFGFGTPVAATPEGGYLETCEEGLSGSWLDTTSVPALRDSIRRFAEGTWDAGAIRQHGERWSPSAFRDQLTGHVDAVLRGEQVR